MTEENVPSGTTDQTSGLEQTTTEPTTTQETKTIDTVAYSSYQKVLTEKKNTQSKLQETMRKLEEIEAREQQRVEEEARKNDDYKKLLELEKEKASTLESKYQELSSQVNTGIKLQSLLKAVDIKEKFWGFVDLDQIVMDPETNQPDSLSIEKVAKEIQDTFPEWLNTTGGPNMPNQAPRQPQGKLTHEQWLNLPLKEKKARLGEVMVQDN